MTRDRQTVGARPAPQRPLSVPTGPPLLPLLLLALALLGAIVAIPLAASAQESAADLDVLSPVGWGAGLVGLLCFMWFRSRDLALAGDRSYVIPRWNPRRVATALGGSAWLISIYHAYIIAEALARR